MKTLCLWLVLLMPALAETLSIKNFKVLGACKLPRQACGFSTAYSTGAIALRYVDGKARIITDTHIESGGLLYEVELPAMKLQDLATARIVAQHYDVYRGLKPEGAVLTGLRWQSSNNSLHWSCGRPYDADGEAQLTSGATALRTMAAWNTTPEKIPELWRRGGSLDVPQHVAKLLKCSHAFGFGGYYSIFDGGSYGPCLGVNGWQMLAYPNPQRCVRPANYWVEKSSWVGWHAEDDVGTWTAADEIGGESHAGGAFWVQQSQLQGVCFLASLGTGKIWYGDDGLTKGVLCEGRENWLAVYKPWELLAVLEGKLDCWEPRPIWYPFPQPVLDGVGRACGTAWNPATNTLYVCFTGAYLQDVETYPIIVAYRLNVVN